MHQSWLNIKRANVYCLHPKDVMCMHFQIGSTDREFSLQSPPSFLSDNEQEPSFVTIQGKSPHRPASSRDLALKALGFPEIDLLAWSLKSLGCRFLGHHRTLLMCLSCRRGFRSWFIWIWRIAVQVGLKNMLAGLLTSDIWICRHSPYEWLK